MVGYLASDDGKTHINAYSRGRTALGQFLSNFARHYIETPDGAFMSVEGYWYWLSSHCDDLRGMSDYYAKQYGESHPKIFHDPDFNANILKAIDYKIKTMPEELAKEFFASRLPIVHYYPLNGRAQPQKSMDFILNRMMLLRTLHKFKR